MDCRYPRLARPQRRLCYFSARASASTMKGNAELDIDDSNTWFKDLDSPSDVGEELPPLPPSPTFAPVEEKTGNPVEEKVEREPSSVPETGEAVPQGEEMHKEWRAENTLLDTESPFKKHAPIKTSSPIKRQEGDEDKDRTASPLLLICDDDDDDDDDEYDHGHVKQPITALTPQCNGQAADGGYDAVLDSPPCRFSVGKQKTPAHSMPKKEETPWKLTLSLCSTETETEEPPQRSPYQAVEPKEQPASGKKMQAQPPKKSLAQPSEKKSLAQPSEKKSLAQPSEKKGLAQPPEKKGLAQPPGKKGLAQPPEKEATQERKAISSFYQKLREAGQSKHACPREAIASPMRAAPLTDLEDDFLILEDDGPSWFSLRRKTDPNRTTAIPRPQQQDQSHSSDDASADTLTKASQSEMDAAKQRSGWTAEVKTKEKNATGGSSLLPVLTKSTARKERDSSPQGDGPVEADHIEQDQKKKVNNPLSEPTTAGDLEPGGRAKPKPSQSKDRTKTEKKVPRISKSQAGIQGDKVNPKTSRGRGRESGETRRLSGGAGEEEESEAAADQDVSPVLQLALTGQRRVTSEVPANRRAKEVGPSPTGEADSSQAGQLTQLAGKRKRIKPGPWWLTSPVNTQVTETDNTHTANKSKHNNKKAKTKPARYSSVESGQEEGTSKPLFNQNAKKKPSSNQTTEIKPWSNQTAEQKAEKPKTGRPKKQKMTSREEPARPGGQREEEAEASTAEEQQELGGLSPMPSPLRQHTLTPSEKVFDWIYTRTPKCKPQSDITPHSATVIPSRSDAYPTTVTPSRQRHQAREAPEKRSRRRKAPGNWWVTDNPPENADNTSSFPQQPQPYPKEPSPPQPQPNPKTRKVERSKFLGPPQNGNTASSTRPGRVHTPLKRKDLSAPKTVKRSLATFGAVFSSGRGALPVATVRSSTWQTSGRKTLFPREPEEQSTLSPRIGLSSGPAKETSQDPASDRSSSPVDLSASTVCIEPVGQLGKKKTIRRDFSQSNNRLSDNTLNGFKSGPSSMIELEDYEENDDICVRSFRVTPHPSVHPGIMLSDPEAVTELCAPPLRAITLQLEDKANLTDWLSLLWPAAGKQGGQISPDHFQWFSYRDRALGYKMDLLAETFSNGKILLGSYMKKPLLVDHSATTVYNLLTSSVTVTINGKKKHYTPGQTFMVPCGHAYSLHNLTQEPAALLFTRMLAEGSE